MFFKIAIVFAVIGVSVTLPLYEGYECQLKNGATGECRTIKHCPSAVKNIHGRQQAAQRFTRCGFNGFEEIICCPDVSRPTEPTSTAHIDVNDGDILFGLDDRADDWEKPWQPPTRRPTLKPKMKERKAERACNDFSKDVPTALAPYILGGESVVQGEFPHMAAVGYAKDSGLSFDCGGTLIANQYVLTAAHCILTRDKIRPSVIRLGTITLNGAFDTSDMDYQVEDHIVHPSYSPAFKYNDIALIKLNREVVTSSNIYPACLNTNPEDPKTVMLVTGWGTTSVQRETRSPLLLKANLTAVPLSQCNVTYTEKKDRRLPNGLTSDQLCAVDLGGVMDSCQGDSGGPLQVPHSVDGMYKVVGVTSFGRACAGGIPAVYARISNYLDWIESVVWP